MSYKQQYWSIRQNPYKNTNQEQMRDTVLKHSIVTCPFGHIGDCRNKVIDAEYSEEHVDWKSYSQDRTFIEKLKIGDIVLIPFSGIRDVLLARIVSEPIYAFNTGLYVTHVNGQITLSTVGELPFRPVVRRIEILKTDLYYPDRRVIAYRTIAHFDPMKLLKDI